MTKEVLRKIIFVLSEYSNQENWMELENIEGKKSIYWIGEGTGYSLAQNVLNDLAQKNLILEPRKVPEQLSLEF